MNLAPQIDRPTFLRHVRQSGLVGDDQLLPLLRQVPEGSAVLLAQTLVERGLLTRFQAERLLAGHTGGFFLGQYRILEPIGKGGHGRVYKAEHRAMQRLVALKVLAANLMNSERAIELFLREMRATGQFVHPNVVTGFDASEVGGRYYLVLEYVDGPNLEELVRQQGPLAWGLACEYLRQAACGLQAAHQLRMVHRDIKPANILVQRPGVKGLPGVVKISDFGLARLGGPAVLGNPHASVPGTILTRDNSVMGTPDYLSPEQARSMHKTDIRSDLYSLGCTFYFLLTGQVPFPGGTMLDKMVRHNTDQPEPIATFRADVPAPVRAIVEKLLAKHPKERFQTPAELATALEPFAVRVSTPGSPRAVAESGPPSTGEGEDFTGLGQTVSGDRALTPPPATRSSRVVLRRVQPEPRRVGLAILLATAIFVGLVGVVGALALLAGR